VDLEQVAGSGPDGAVVAADLEGDAFATATATAAAPPGEPGEPAGPTGARATATPPGARAGMRDAIARLMTRSAQEIPHYHLLSSIDLLAATTWLGDHNADRPVSRRILPAALLLKATARAVASVDGFNGSWDGGYRPSRAVHLGVAISLRGGGLVAPAIHDADALAVDDLMAALQDLVGRARAGRLRSSEMSDPTVTVTNLGEQGAEEVLGVIYRPQVALVGFGRITDQVRAQDGMIAIRPTVRASLAADHRVTDGHAGSRLLQTIDDLLQRPEDL
jgi:pyruvate dehydrogenase E2 component (dihydrolipoamide acetyltransferase)